MSLPYENSTAGSKALGEIQRILRRFGCSRFGSMIDDGAQEILIQFTHRGRDVTVRASIASSSTRRPSPRGSITGSPSTVV